MVLLCYIFDDEVAISGVLIEEYNNAVRIG